MMSVQKCGLASLPLIMEGDTLKSLQLLTFARKAHEQLTDYTWYTLTDHKMR